MSARTRRTHRRYRPVRYRRAYCAPMSTATAPATADDAELSLDDCLGWGDWLRTCTHGETLRPPRSHLDRGEYDPWRTMLSARDRRRLAARGYTSRGGIAPDVLADIILHTVGLNMDGGESCAWYLDLALRAVEQDARRPRRPHPMAARDRHATRTLGRPATYFALRTYRAQAAGFPSYRAQRAALATERTPS